jgi:hypothetical protein
VCVSARAAVSRWPMGPSPSARLCAMPAAAAGADVHRKRGSANGPSLPACTAPGAALGGRVCYSSGSPRRSYFRCFVAGPHSAVETLSPGCASSALAGSMGFPNQQEENPVPSAAFTHSVLDQELFKLCFEQVVVSRIGGKRPSVKVYALCKGSCKMTAEDRWKHPCTSSRPRSGAFDPAKCLTEALKDLVSRHKDCFQPQITELTWERLTSSWAVAGPSASHGTTEPPSVTAGDGCGDTSTAMTEQEARIVEDAVVPPDAQRGSAVRVQQCRLYRAKKMPSVPQAGPFGPLRPPLSGANFLCPRPEP